MNKRIIISTVGTILVVGGIGAASSLNQPKQVGADTSPITTQLEQQSQELANHEARITNVEDNVSSLENKSNTPASSNSTVAMPNSTGATSENTPLSPVTSTVVSPGQTNSPQDNMSTTTTFVGTLDPSSDNGYIPN